MASYTIYEKPGLSLDKTIESAVIVKNHYSALAFFLPVIWMLVRRLWWVLFSYVLFMLPIWSLYGYLPLWSEMLISLLTSAWISAEAPSLIGWQLERKGYVEVVTLFAESRDHCELRYVDFRLNAAKQATPATTGLTTTGKPPLAQRKYSPFFKAKPTDRMESGPVIGLFPTPDPSQETK